MPTRAIIDTNVFLSALWSTRGAAFEIFAHLRRGSWQIVLSNHLLFEYEEVAKRTATETGLALQDIDNVLDAAVEAKVPIIVTRNLGHLKPAESFGIEVLTPAQFLAKLKAGI